MKVKIRIPESLDDIKLKDFQKYAKAEAEEFSQDDLKLKMVQYFCGLKVPDIRAIKASDMESIIDDLSAVFLQKKDFIKSFEYAGVEYGFIPDLENISFGEYIDLNTYLSDVDTIHKAMAVMYRPIVLRSKDMYLIEEYETADKYADVMKEAPVSAYLGSQVFFYNLGKELLRATASFLEGEIMVNLELQQIFRESGAGIPQFMQLLKGSFGDSLWSLN